jgi:hypothetical protein
VRQEPLVKRALTLIELLVTFFILVVTAGSLSFGFLHYSRQETVKNAQDRLERLLAQADFLSTILQQEAKVYMVQENERWYATLEPWGDEESEVLDIFAKLSRNFVELEGVEKFQLNSTSFTELSLVFLPMQGIDPSYIQAKDWAGSLLTPRELGLDMRNQKLCAMTLTFCGKGQNKERTVNLLPYARISSHIPIPQEYIDRDM